MTNQTTMQDDTVSSHFNASMTNFEIIQVLIQAAKVHGRDSEPDHEAGDLQDSIRAAWGLLDNDQKAAFFRIDPVKSVMEGVDYPFPVTLEKMDVETLIEALAQDIEYLGDEINDLRTILLSCGSVMTPEQAHQLPETDGIQTLMEIWPDDLND